MTDLALEVVQPVAREGDAGEGVLPLGAGAPNEGASAAPVAKCPLM